MDHNDYELAHRRVRASGEDPDEDGLGCIKGVMIAAAVAFVVLWIAAMVWRPT